jgi:uncharacterized NAD(P)/FAD-binding protein YdhS
LTPGHVVIVGGGFSGALTALHLLADPAGPRVTLVDRTGTFGLGAAYATRDSEHLLNTRAGNMSAFPDRPDHFLRWLLDRSDDPALGRMSFAPRMAYGAYLRDLVAETVAGEATGRLVLTAADAVSVRRHADGFTVGLADGSALDADATVLALGNLAPAPPPAGDDVLASPRYVAEPWRVDLSGRVGPDDAILLVGTGLTMVDVVASLAAQGHRGPFLALSRRGLLPRAHVEAPPHKHAPPPPDPTLSVSLRTLRRLVATGGADWRTVFDGLRPVTATLWANMRPADRSRFLRHARPWWDVHRHRLAPKVAARIDALRASGQLRVAAGRLVQIRTAGDRFEAVWRPRGKPAMEVAAARWVINCVGPHADVRRAGEPVLDSLLEAGLARPDPLHLGLEVDADSRVVDAEGRTRPDFVAVGPLTRSSFWESTAVPDIRVQVAEVARRLGAHLRRPAIALDPAPRRR